MVYSSLIPASITQGFDSIDKRAHKAPCPICDKPEAHDCADNDRIDDPHDGPIAGMDRIERQPDHAPHQSTLREEGVQRGASCLPDRQGRVAGASVLPESVQLRLEPGSHRLVKQLKAGVALM